MAMVAEPTLNEGVCTFRCSGSTIEIDLQNKRARANDRPVHTSVREFAMIRLLVQNVGRVQSMAALAKAATDAGDGVAPQRANNVLHNLRTKFDRSRAGAGDFLRRVEDGWVVHFS